MLLHLPAPPRQRSCQPSCGMSFIKLSPRAHTCNLCLRSCLRLSRGCFWLQMPPWAVGEVGRGWGCSYLQGWQWGAWGRCPAKPQLSLAGLCCSLGTLLPFQGVLTLPPNTQKISFSGGISSAGFAHAQGGSDLFQKVSSHLCGMQSISQCCKQASPS